MKTGSVTTDYRTAAQTLIGHLDGQIAELQSIRTGLMGLVTHDGLRTVGACRSEIEAATLGTKPPKAGKVAGISQQHPWRSKAGRIFLKDPRTVTVADKIEEERAEREEAPSTNIQAPEKLKASTSKPDRGPVATQGKKCTPAEAVGVIATMAEPFGAESIMAATGLDADQTRNLLCRLRMRERIERIAHGQWKRTDNFTAE